MSYYLSSWEIFELLVMLLTGVLFIERVALDLCSEEFRFDIDLLSLSKEFCFYLLGSGFERIGIGGTPRGFSNLL